MLGVNAVRAAFVPLAFLPVLAAAIGAPPPPPPPSISDNGAAPEDANDLGLQVEALRTIHGLALTARQLRSLESLSSGAAAKDRRQEKKVTDKVRAALTELREAFLKQDETKIDEAEDRLVDLYEAEDPDLDDDVTATDAAIRRAPAVVAMLTPTQITNYLGLFREDVPDPAELLADVAARGRKLRGADWTNLRDETAEELGRLIGGLDAKRADKAQERVSRLLDLARAAPGEGPGRPEFEREMRSLIGSEGNWLVLRNALLHDAAELLANPQLSAVLRARALRKPPAASRAP